MTISTKILRIKDGKFYYTENDSINIKDTNIPDGKLSFSCGRDIFWKVELFNYDIKTETVRLRVLDYSPENVSNYYEQKQKKPVKKFLFEKLDWSTIGPQLSSYQISALCDIMEGLPNIENRNNGHSEIEGEINKLNLDLNENSELSNVFKNSEFTINRIVKINEEFSFYYKSANFEDGFVSVNYKPKLCSEKEEIKIFNSKLRSEFNYVKNYFPKYLKKGEKFYVQLCGEVQFGKLINYEATSDEIQSINENVISIVRNLIDLKIFDTLDTGEIDKNVFSIEELIEESKLDVSIKDSINREPQKLLDSIIKIKDVKNKKQLEYLASFKQKGNYQLRFTLKPLFGFIFCVESSKENHFCWELLNSHATYIWSFDTKYDFVEKLNDIDKIINYIRINGRKKYRELVKTEGGNDFLFTAVYHKNKLTKFKDGFIEWKNEIEKIMSKTSDQ